MLDPAATLRATAATRDPTTSAAELEEIARAIPDLWPEIAAHAHVTSTLLDWLDDQGDTLVSAVVAARRKALAQHVQTDGAGRLGTRYADTGQPVAPEGGLETLDEWDLAVADLPPEPDAPAEWDVAVAEPGPTSAPEIPTAWDLAVAEPAPVPTSTPDTRPTIVDRPTTWEQAAAPVIKATPVIEATPEAPPSVIPLTEATFLVQPEAGWAGTTATPDLDQLSGWDGTTTTVETSPVVVPAEVSPDATGPEVSPNATVPQASPEAVRPETRPPLLTRPSPATEPFTALPITPAPATPSVPSAATASDEPALSGSAGWTVPDWSPRETPAPTPTPPVLPASASHSKTRRRPSAPAQPARRRTRLIGLIVGGVIVLALIAFVVVRFLPTNDGTDSATITCSETIDPFLDVPRQSSFFDAVCWLATEGIVRTDELTAYSEGEGTAYRPGDRATRAATALMLYRTAGAPRFSVPKTSPFQDVSPSDPAYRAIAWLASRDIISGTTFEPETTISRGQAADWLYRFTGSPAFTAPEQSPFSDVVPSHSLYQAIAWMADRGIATDFGGSPVYRPEQPLTRGALASFIYRLEA
jgi:hypothetical protein